MKIQAIKTRLVRAGECTLEDILTESITNLEEGSVVAISSKVVALCQNRVVSKDDFTKDELIKREADYYYTPQNLNGLNFSFTIVGNSFIPTAGIDESNVDGHYVLWPKDPQKVANKVCQFLKKKFAVKNVGVIVTDSTCMPPMRVGTIGIVLAHSGFLAVKRLVGTTDLFGRKFEVSQSAIASGLAAAANVVMGEGAEQTPVAVISDVPFVQFQDHDPTPEELKTVYVSPEEDLYAPFIMSAPWQKGGGRTAK